MNEDIQREIKKRIDEIEEKSANGDYIYRGEPKRHRKVSSTLYRRHAKEIEAEYFDIEVVQNEMLIEAKRYIHEKDELEILTQLQHYGGKTNLIDFTTDYLIALFFACDGYHDKHGRIIMVKKTEKIKDWIKEPRNPQHRVIAQKSIFVRPPRGFIEPHDVGIVIIPADLKQPLLQYLRKYHGISTETIYNDLHGFIRHESIHHRAYIDFYIGLSHLSLGEFDHAITVFTKAIDLYPNFAAAYNNRGMAYGLKHNLNRAIENLDRAIQLDSNYAAAYCNRGLAYGLKGQFDCAIKDCTRAIDLKPDYAAAYLNRGMAYGLKRDLDRAIVDYNKAIDLKSDYAEAYNNRGIVYRKQGDLDRAIVDYNKAIDLKPDYAEAHNNRGRAYHDEGEVEHAIENYSTAIELNPNYGIAYCNRGIAWLRLEKWEDVKSDLTTAEEKGVNIINVFRNNHESVAAFEERYDIQLPADIAEMLTPTQS